MSDVDPEEVIKRAFEHMSDDWLDFWIFVCACTEKIESDIKKERKLLRIVWNKEASLESLIPFDEVAAVLENARQIAWHGAVGDITLMIKEAKQIRGEGLAIEPVPFKTQYKVSELSEKKWYDWLSTSIDSVIRLQEISQIDELWKVFFILNLCTKDTPRQCFVYMKQANTFYHAYKQSQIKESKKGKKLIEIRWKPSKKAKASVRAEYIKYKEEGGTLSRENFIESRYERWKNHHGDNAIPKKSTIFKEWLKNI